MTNKTMTIQLYTSILFYYGLSSHRSYEIMGGEKCVFYCRSCCSSDNTHQLFARTLFTRQVVCIRIRELQGVAALQHDHNSQLLNSVPLATPLEVRLRNISNVTSRNSLAWRLLNDRVLSRV